MMIYSIIQTIIGKHIQVLLLTNRYVKNLIIDMAFHTVKNTLILVNIILRHILIGFSDPKARRLAHSFLLREQTILN